MAIEIVPLLERVIARENLSEQEVQDLFGAIMHGDLAPELTAGILVALRAKGESVPEVTGAARAMRAASKTIAAPENAIDMCGTGGDGSNTVNVSTAASLVLAAADVPVAKHGNRSISSRSGSADVLEQLGIPVDMSPEDAEVILARDAFAFLFAPNYHPAMKHAIGPRRALKIRTVFNLLGPLTNPAGVQRQVMGVYAAHWIKPLAEVLKKLGAVHVMVLHSDDGMDEISLGAPTQIAELENGEITVYSFDPAEYGFQRVGKDQLSGGDASYNANVLLEAFDEKTGPIIDWIVLNAASGFRVARNLDWSDSIALARQVIQENRVLPLIEKLKQ